VGGRYAGVNSNADPHPALRLETVFVLDSKGRRVPLENTDPHPALRPQAIDFLNPQVRWVPRYAPKAVRVPDPRGRRVPRYARRRSASRIRGAAGCRSSRGTGRSGGNAASTIVS